MTSRKLFGLAAASCALFASAVLYAEFKAGFYQRESSGLILQTPPRTSSDGATYDVGSYPLYPPLLASGDGEREVASYCNVCHSPRYITMQPPLPADTWTAEVNKMVKTYGASIPDDAMPKIIQYLQAHYTPETRKK